MRLLLPVKSFQAMKFTSRPSKKADELHEWIKDRKQMLVALSPEIQQVAELLRDYPRLVDTLKGRSQADPFVIATAIVMTAVVVTGEIRTGNLGKPRIPDVCNAKGIRWINRSGR